MIKHDTTIMLQGLRVCLRVHLMREWVSFLWPKSEITDAEKIK